MTTPTTLIDIKNYPHKFTAFPEDFLEFCAKNGVKLPGIDSLKGQALTLMAQPEVRGQKHLGREEVKRFFEQIGLATDDAIQPFNKAAGLKRMKCRGMYCLVYPFETDMTDVEKRKGCSISGDKDTAVNIIKQQTHN